MRDDELKRMLRNISLEDPGDLFADSVMAVVEAQEEIYPRKVVGPVVSRMFVMMVCGVVLLVFGLAIFLRRGGVIHGHGRGYFSFVGEMGSEFMAVAGSVLVYGVPIILLLVGDYFLRVRRPFRNF